MLENDCGPLPVPAFHKLCCCQISRRYLVRALFDEDVHNVSAAYLTKCVPAFEESDCGDGVQSRLNSLHIIPKDLLELYIHLGEERYSATAAGNQHELELLRFCEDLARKLDGYWPRWHGWQEIHGSRKRRLSMVSSNVSLCSKDCPTVPHPSQDIPPPKEH